MENLNFGWNSLEFAASNGTALKYQLYIPEDFDKNKSYPAILYMHSAGVRCDDNSHIYTGEAKFLRNLESGKYKDECFVIAPCCPKEDKWVSIPAWTADEFDSDTQPQSAHMEAAMELYSLFLDKFPIDKSRMYLYGMSMGAFAVWDILSRYPRTFAAAAVAAGRGMPKHADRMLDVGIWIFHGTADKAINYQYALDMRDAFAALGKDDLRFTTFEGAGHGIWVLTANTDGIYDWMFSHRRSEV